MGLSLSSTATSSCSSSDSDDDDDRFQAVSTTHGLIAPLATPPQSPVLSDHDDECQGPRQPSTSARGTLGGGEIGAGDVDLGPREFEFVFGKTSEAEVRGIQALLETRRNEAIRTGGSEGTRSSELPSSSSAPPENVDREDEVQGVGSRDSQVVPGDECHVGEQHDDDTRRSADNRLITVDVSSGSEGVPELVDEEDAFQDLMAHGCDPVTTTSKSVLEEGTKSCFEEDEEDPPPPPSPPPSAARAQAIPDLTPPAPSPWLRMDFAPPTRNSRLAAHHRGLLCYQASEPDPFWPHLGYSHRVWVCDPVAGNQAQARAELPPHPDAGATAPDEGPAVFQVLALHVDDDGDRPDGARPRPGGNDGRRHFTVTALVSAMPRIAGALSTVEYRSRARAWATLVHAGGPGTLRDVRSHAPVEFGRAGTRGGYMYVLAMESRRWPWDPDDGDPLLHSRDECQDRRCRTLADADDADDDDEEEEHPHRRRRLWLMRLDLARPAAAGWTECRVRGLAALDRVCPALLVDPRGRLLLQGARHLVLEDRDAGAGDRTACVWEVVESEGARGRWWLRELASAGTAALAAGRAALPAAAWFCVDGDEERVYFRVEGEAQLLVLDWGEPSSGGVWYWMPASPVVQAACGGGRGGGRGEAVVSYEVVPLCPRTDGVGLVG